MDTNLIDEKYYNKLLVAFMKEKAKKIADVLSISPEYYFNKKDEQSILEWPLSNAIGIWNKLNENIKNGESGLTYSSCPFCIRYIGCDMCEYGQHHGICSSVISGYNPIKSKIITIFHNIRTFPSNADYKEILQKIENNIGKINVD